MKESGEGDFLRDEKTTQIGLKNIKKCRQIIVNARAGRNDTRSFINGLSSRYRGYVYFAAGLHIEKHRLKFEALSEHDRRKVIISLRELRDLFSQIPRSLSDADSIVK
ncbi:hypothetical protein [Serratia proteamaculans]